MQQTLARAFVENEGLLDCATSFALCARLCSLSFDRTPPSEHRRDTFIVRALCAMRLEHCVLEFMLVTELAIAHVTNDPAALRPRVRLHFNC